jgi:hypothetical protein
VTPLSFLRPLAVVTLLAFSVAVSACGNSESTSGSSTSGSSTSGSTEAAPPPAEKEFAVRQGATKGFVDSAKAEGSTVLLTGWAASTDLKGPADFVAAKVGGKTVTEALPTVERSDVAAFYGKPGLKQSGFELRIPTSKLDCSKPAGGLKVYGVLNGNGSVLEMVENTKPEIESAC